MNPISSPEDLAEYVLAAPSATDVIDTASAAGHIDAPPSGLKAAELRFRAPLHVKAPASEGCQDDLASAEGVIAALRRARDQSDTASRRVLGGARRDLREPLTALLRLHSDWDVRGTDMVAVRMIEQQRQALDVMADLIDGLLRIAESEMGRLPGPLTNLASRSAGERREASAMAAPRAEEPSAERIMISAVDRSEAPVAVGLASRARRILLIDEDRAVLGALRMYLLCAGYRVYAAANSDEALNRARTATSPIDLIIATLDLTGDDDGLAVIEKTRLLLGYNVPAVLLTTQTSIEIGKPALQTNVCLLTEPVNVDEFNALIGEVLKSARRSRLAHLRTTGAKLDHDDSGPQFVC